MIARIARFFGYVPATPVPVMAPMPPGFITTAASYIAAKHQVRELLNDDRYTWRTLDTLVRKTGMDVDTVQRILSDIGARGSRDNATRTFPIYRLR